MPTDTIKGILSRLFRHRKSGRHDETIDEAKDDPAAEVNTHRRWRPTIGCRTPGGLPAVMERRTARSRLYTGKHNAISGVPLDSNKHTLGV